MAAPHVAGAVLLISMSPEGRVFCLCVPNTCVIIAKKCASV